MNAAPTPGDDHDHDPIADAIADEVYGSPATSLPGSGRFPPPPASLRDEAYHGPAGDFVTTINPHSEADPAATLIQLLLAFGNACGRGPGFMVESDRHATNEFVAIVGKTA